MVTDLNLSQKWLEPAAAWYFTSIVYDFSPGGAKNHTRSIERHWQAKVLFTSFVVLFRPAGRKELRRIEILCSCVLLSARHTSRARPNTAHVPAAASRSRRRSRPAAIGRRDDRHQVPCRECET